MDRPSPELIHCPICHVKNFAIDDRCAACSEPLTVVILPRPKVRRIALATVMVMVAVLAVCFAIVRESPPLGMAFSMVVIPAALRTMLECESRKEDHRPMTRREVAQRAVESITIGLVLVPVALLSCLVVAVPIHTSFFPWARANGDTFWILQVSYGFGAILGMMVSFILARRIWPSKD